jgi:hypothetical protein
MKEKAGVGLILFLECPCFWSQGERGGLVIPLLEISFPIITSRRRRAGL